MKKNKDKKIQQQINELMKIVEDPKNKLPLQ